MRGHRVVICFWKALVLVGCFVGPLSLYRLHRASSSQQPPAHPLIISCLKPPVPPPLSSGCLVEHSKCSPPSGVLAPSSLNDRKQKWFYNFSRLQKEVDIVFIFLTKSLTYRFALQCFILLKQRYN